MSSAFNYVTAEKAKLYRPVMRVFANAKAHFIVHLRPEEVFERLDIENAMSLEEISKPLEQLVAWGNLLAQPDTGRVTTVEDFYRDSPSLPAISARRSRRGRFGYI